MSAPKTKLKTTSKTTTKQKQKSAGRPTKYSKNCVLSAEFMARAGMIDKDMAVRFGIVESTFQKWKKDHPEFAEALTRGKEEPDDKVEAALMKSAIGYYVEEVTMQRNAEGVITNTTLTKRWVPSSTGSLCFWLKNRRPNLWRDKQEIKIDMEHDPLVVLGKALKDFRIDSTAAISKASTSS